MIDTQAIRSKILDLAVRGQLTEQLPEDGTAEELLKILATQKTEIEKSGILKGRKKKNVQSLEDVELPFIVPVTWQWIRLDSVAEIFGRIGFRGYTKSDIVDHGQGAISLSPSNITKDGNIVFDKNTYISWEKYNESPEIMVSEGDIIIVKTGSSYGKCAIASSLPEKATINPQLAILKYVLCSRNYLHIVLNSTMARKQYEAFVVGAATPTFSQEDLANFLLPLPPIAEQKRIVERVEQAFSVLDTIDKLQAQYADNRTALKAKLIDLAIQGKLTEQLPEDGTAEELYQQIQAEKQALIKSGKIKKEKPLPEIKDNEIPFDIPDNWKWVHLAEICSIINGDRGKNYPAKSTLKHEGIPFISALNLDGVSVKQDEHLLCLDDRQYELLGNGKLQKGDIVICIRGSLGKHGRYPFDKGAIASSLVISRLFYSQEIIGDYEMIWLDSSAFPVEIKRFGSGTAQPNLAANNLEKFLIPLPPLAEQKRIVERLDQILAVCDEETRCENAIISLL